jgi:hypothetical protein
MSERRDLGIAGQKHNLVPMGAQGELMGCSNCNGAEGTLPTDCPGIPITEKDQDDIMSGILDFVNGKWVVPNQAPAPKITRIERHAPDGTVHIENLKEAVDHPSHYGGDTVYEHIKVVEAWGLNYALGNATKYIARAGKKTKDPIQDLEKAKWYIQHEIDRLKKQ